MKASEFIGMEVIDKEANEVGKIAELAVTLKKCMVDKIFITTGSALSKRFFAIVEEDIAAVGDYVQLKLDRKALEEKVKVDKLEDLVSEDLRFKNMVGKVVLAQKGMEVGKIEDMVIDPKGCLIHNIIISTGGTFNKKHFMISDTDISEIGDYMILKLDKNQVEEMVMD
jgi:sporulation protein YlmC with PRC-barrel domain